MSLVIGLSGAQGGGKSTLLKELMSRGFKVDELRVSRTIQAELGWKTLDRVMQDVDTMMDFQTRVFDRKLKNDLGLRNDGGTGIILVERTFADLMAYTNLWMWRFVDKRKIELSDAMEWLAGYSGRCRAAHKEIYGATLLLPLMDNVVFENDPHRASENDAERVYEEVEAFVTRMVGFEHKRLIITTRSVESRADQVQRFIEAL